MRRMSLFRLKIKVEKKKRGTHTCEIHVRIPLVEAIFLGFAVILPPEEIASFLLTALQ